MAAAGSIRSAPTRRTVLFGLLAVLLVAACLRPPITAVGPLLDRIGADTGLGSTGLGVLGAVPLLCFAAVSPWIHRPAVRYGSQRLILLALGVLAAGILVRSLPGGVWLWVGTVAIGSGIAVANVLLPAVVKRDHAGRLTTVTGVYSSVTTGAAGLGSGLAVPLAVATGNWRTALAVWAILPCVAGAVWYLRGRIRPGEPAAQPPAVEPGPRRSMWRSGVAWQVTAFMGLQSTTFYLLVTWLPSIEASLGVDAATAGWHSFAYQVVGIVAGLGATALMGDRADQSLLAVIGGAILVVATVGILLVPGLVLLWAIVAGISSGATFVLAMSLFGLRTRTVAQTAQLSGMAQCVGYLLAMCGPIAAGAIFDVTGTWAPVLILIAVCAAGQSLIGGFAGRDRYTHLAPTG
ncbi:CynX/NimT family MFS transporter [Rhodococcus phenolicus]|uniref:CynX/NimT family MFS transporter n=1 Tax=Rhodococcus phenolicus TaxID=263849 RepID=UPI000829E1B6|nr:MFS transporter [Rhodococcus phenolicus]